MRPTLGVTHPMHTVRAAEIQKWVAAGDYERILAGEYVRRGSPEDQRPLGEHWKDAKDYYSKEAKDFGQQVGDAVRSTASKAAEAFRNAQKRGSSA